MTDIYNDQAGQNLKAKIRQINVHPEYLFSSNRCRARIASIIDGSIENVLIYSNNKLRLKVFDMLKLDRELLQLIYHIFY